MMNHSRFALLILCAALPASLGTAYAGVGDVVIRPSPDEVHNVIRELGTKSLKKWIAWDRQTLDIRDPDTGRTPLMTALIAEKPKHFRLLLKSGANPELTDSVGNSALHVAAQINEPWRILELLKSGANAELRNGQGQTFQRFLYMPRESLLNADTRKGRTAVIDWLNDHGVAVEPATAS